MVRRRIISPVIFELDVVCRRMRLEASVLTPSSSSVASFLTQDSVLDCHLGQLQPFLHAL